MLGFQINSVYRLIEKSYCNNYLYKTVLSINFITVLFSMTVILPVTKCKVDPSDISLEFSFWLLNMRKNSHICSQKKEKKEKP